MCHGSPRAIVICNFTRRGEAMGGWHLELRHLVASTLWNLNMPEDWLGNIDEGN